MTLTLTSLALALSPIVLAAALSAWLAVRDNAIIGLSFLLGSMLLSEWFRHGLKESCAINVAECGGAGAAMFLFGLAWLLIVLLVGGIIWTKRGPA